MNARAAPQRHALAFWCGAAAIAFGVSVHLPPFFASAPMGYRMAGMPMDAGMTTGMIAIAAGLVVAAWGLFGDVPLESAGPADAVRAYGTLVAIVPALVIDVMKPATLGFVLPGMMAEYGLIRPAVALLPLVALGGTVIGSIAWGIAGDRFGRRATILLAALMFMGTSICGAMPSFAANVAMCFAMGLAAGGMIPIAFAIVAETLPAQQRGFALVLIGGIGAAGGYLAASGAAALLTPAFGWRALWLLGLPTGVLLAALSPFIIEPRRRSSGATAYASPHAAARGTSAVTFWLNFGAVAWSTINFGFLLWLPANLREAGLPSGFGDALVMKSALLSFATTPLVATAYRRYGAQRTLVVLAGVQAAVLPALIRTGSGIAHVPTAVTIVLIALLLVAANGFICSLLPFAVETYPALWRTTGAGLVGASSKAGGLLGLLVAKFAVTPGITESGIIATALILLSGIGIGTLSTRSRKML